MALSLFGAWGRQACCTTSGNPSATISNLCASRVVLHHHVDSDSGGWQYEAASRVEQQFRDQVLFERLPAQARASMRSQAGPGAGIALSVVPTGCLTQILPHLARVILPRRLRPIDSFGHHRAACARSGVLGRNGVRSRKCCISYLKGGLEAARTV